MLMKVVEYVNDCMYYGEIPNELNYNIVTNPNNYLRKLPKGFENMIGGKEIIQIMMDDVRIAGIKNDLVYRIVSKVDNDLNMKFIDGRAAKRAQLCREINSLEFI